MNLSQVQPKDPTLGMHNWRHLWESPIKLWFGKDSSKGKMLEGRSGDNAKSGSVGSSWDPRGGNEDRKDVKIGSASERRNNLAREKGHIKHFKRY